MIYVSDAISLDERDIEVSFVRSSGPGGQHVNKVATAVQLRFDIRSLPGDVRKRLVVLAGRRLTADGVLVITARRYRSQERNRSDAERRLVDLVRRATERPEPRRKTRPTRASNERRLRAKKARSATKKTRRRGSDDA